MRGNHNQPRGLFALSVVVAGGMAASALGAPIDAGANHDNLRRGDLVFWKGHVGVMCDAETLLHANGHHMQVAREPFSFARARIAEKTFGEVTCVRRL
mgnify:CR=1 FL=1